MAKKITQKYTDYNRIQILMQLHDKGLLSSRTLLTEFGLDYDQEILQMKAARQYPYNSITACCEKPEDCTGCDKVKTAKTTKPKKK